MSDDRVINMDQMRAAQAETQGIAPEVVFGGLRFTLPVKLPARFAIALTKVDLEESLAQLFGDRVDEFWALQPSLDDVENLVDAVSKIYALGSPGKSEASGA